MFEGKDDVGEKIPSLRCNRLWHCKCAIDPLNTGDRLNERRLPYPDSLHAHRIDQMGVTTRFPILPTVFGQIFLTQPGFF